MADFISLGESHLEDKGSCMVCELSELQQGI